MGNGPNADGSFTQRLSREIDAAYRDYDVGQPDTEARLYQALRAQARNIVWHRLGSPDESLEHDIAVRAIRALKTFRGACRTSSWFYTVARREANRALRTLIEKRERLVPIEIDEDDDEPKIALRAASANLDAPIDLEELIRDLPEEQAEVIKLRREGHSLEDIAERTGEPLGIIRGRNRLALSKARKKIAPE